MRQLGWILLFSVVSVTAFQFVSAQTTEGETKPSPKTEQRRGPLPDNYGKIGMSDEQKEQAYKIQDEYDGKLEALKLEMKKLLAERDGKLMGLLTDGQKLRMQELQAAAKEKAKKPLSKPAEKPVEKKE